MKNFEKAPPFTTLKEKKKIISFKTPSVEKFIQKYLTHSKKYKMAVMHNEFKMTEDLLLNRNWMDFYFGNRY